MKRFKQHPKTYLIILLFLLLVILGFTVRRVSAQTGDAGTSTPAAFGTAAAQAEISNETCLACHGNPGQQVTLPSGEVLVLTVNPDEYNNSIHGKQGLTCTNCHTNITGYPHPPINVQNHREFTIRLYQSCAGCHKDQYDQNLDSVHQKALAAGNENAAVCSDCHGAHNIQPFKDQPRSAVPQTCARCHSQIYNLYKDSVHGSALIGQGNSDVPSCTDCHGVHKIEGPSNSPFRLFSPQICAKCHANQQLMNKYQINTNVFNTYLGDFHGTTVEMFQAVAPGQQTNKPVCIDCHSVHDIKEVNDPNSTVIKENLLRTCRRCHPDATENFPSAWLSHYEPSPQRFPVVFYVQTFYKIFVPTVLGGMALFVVSDIGRRIYNRREKRHE